MTDCCIIGGGIIGLSIARELAGRGLSVRVLARDGRRDTASWAAAGIFPPAPASPAATPNEQLTSWSDRLHREWARQLFEETGVDTGFRTCGGLHVGCDEAARERLRSDAAAWRARGAACDWLEAHELAACEPALATAVAAGRARLGYLLPEETQMRPPRHLDALTRSCRQRGVTISVDATVREILLGNADDGRVVGLTVDVAGVTEQVTAGAYVLAAGAWSGDLAARLGLRIETRPIRGQIVQLRMRQPWLGRVVNRGLDYLVPRDDGTLLAGSTLEDIGFDATTVPAALDRLVAVATDLLGELESLVPERSWAGLRPGSVDGLPVIGPVPRHRNAFVAAGHFRAGLHQSTGTAVIIADLLEGRTSPVDPTPFAADRPPQQPSKDSVSAMLARARADA